MQKDLLRMLYSEYAYENDALGRRTAKNAETYGYNDRNELTSASRGSQSSATEYLYSYDDIGNRETATEPGASTIYTANELNQYTSIDDFTPTYDLDMRPRRRRRVARGSEATEPRSGRKRPRNQTLVKTITGEWQVAYNGENHPVSWTCGATNIVMTFDYQRVNNVAAHYEYAPFGAVTATSSSTPVTAYDFTSINPYRFSSEFHDDTLGLVCYNFRHYNPIDGNWICRDIRESFGESPYCYCVNLPINLCDCSDVAALFFLRMGFRHLVLKSC